MYKYFILFFLALSCQGTVITFPDHADLTDQLSSLERIERDTVLLWTTHLWDFLSLIDVEKVLQVSVHYVNDPEVIRFFRFIFGPDFKKLVLELESLEEFKEAYLFLANRGYDTKVILDFINLVLELPPYNKPKENVKIDLLRIFPPKKGMSGFIINLLEVLPLEEMKKLFETKLRNDPEIAELITTLDSPEFLKILKRLARNPKIDEIRTVFESHGLDLKSVCTILNEVVGKLC